MNDEHLISLLRAGAERAPLAETDIPRAQVIGRRMRRRRHAAAAVGSGLTVAGFVALLTLASPSGQSVMQSPLPAAQLGSVYGATPEARVVEVYSPATASTSTPKATRAPGATPATTTLAALAAAALLLIAALVVATSRALPARRH